MTKTHILLVLFLITLPAFLVGQVQFSYNIKGLSPKYVVQDMEGVSQQDLHKKALSWAKSQGYTLSEIQSPNTFTITGEKSNALCFTVRGKTSCNDLRYTVAIAFKDNKYKFEVKGLEQYGPINDTGKKGWFPVELEKAPDAFYTRGGELKKEYLDTPGNISGLFNSLNAKLKKGLLKKPAEVEDDGW